MNIEPIIKDFKKYNQSPQDEEMIRKAFQFAKISHQGQKRYSDEDYIGHPLAAAKILTRLKLDGATIAASLLHDTLEDDAAHPMDQEEIERHFGKDIVFLVNGVTKLGKIKYHGVAREAENLRKMILAMAQDIRVILIKLADRLHNMETLHYVPERKRRRIAQETIEIYAPLAHRLGIGEIKGKLEDLAFGYLWPEEYSWIMANVGNRYEEREKYLEKVTPIILAELKKENITPLRFDYRAKHYFSLWQKLLKHEMNLDLMHDLVAVRLILPDLASCYGALGAIHKIWKPLPGRIKDYIALPKPNGYRSLHTTVFCQDEKIVEFQIRTQEMHAEAEYGIVAHWLYSESGKTGKKIETDEQNLAWVKQLSEWQKEFSKPEEFLERLKIDFFQDRIFVLTPKGQIIDLPEGSTPVDFAYQIHTEIGDACAGAKINNRIAPLNTKLKNGDVVEIVIQKNKKPSPDWFEFVQTSFAKNRIRKIIKQSKFSGLSQWEAEKIPRAELRIVFERDRIGLIKEVSSVVSASKINIENIFNESKEKGSPLCLTLRLREKSQLPPLVTKIKGIKGVAEISHKLIVKT
ncbi:MAG: RelA/SpoT family protein [Parcubacteria group bacterium]|nr:RelA/SpoT family protein [Parcubacteria group bacterium]